MKRRQESGEPREQRHPRAHFRFRAVEGDEKGDALTREILIPCQRQEGCRGENYVLRGWPALQRLSSSTTVLLSSSSILAHHPRSPIHPPSRLLCPLFHPSTPLWTYRQLPQAATPAIPAQPPRRRAGLPPGGVTNQRLAIVNSTCAVKQLINKRLFTSCARSRQRRRRWRWRRLAGWPPRCVCTHFNSRNIFLFFRGWIQNGDRKSWLLKEDDYQRRFGFTQRILVEKRVEIKREKEAQKRLRIRKCNVDPEGGKYGCFTCR